jgi:glycosyltransferase involved in cell wall biosynthesis
VIIAKCSLQGASLTNLSREDSNAQSGPAPIKLLLEMRPSMDGFAGIPQETRLLFRGLCMIEGMDVEGMIQTAGRELSKGTHDEVGFFGRKLFSESRRINRYSRVVVSLSDRPFTTISDRIKDWIGQKLESVLLTLGTLLGIKTVRLSNFRSQYFEDFTWRTLFSKTLPASDFALVSSRSHRICSVPWKTMHSVGLHTLNFLPVPIYPVLDTKGIDIFIGQTPYPARMRSGTALVIRYHDALPIFMPHTIGDQSMHQATHFYGLQGNVRSKAWFACVSDATRRDLLRLFPEADSRAVTIHNMVSHHYYADEAPKTLVPGIIRSRLYEGDPDQGIEFSPKFFSVRERERFYAKHLFEPEFRYLMAVSTIEPRKNHARLIAAWEVLKAEVDPTIKLVIVGTLGWGTMSIVKSWRAWIDRGELFTLHAVPAPDLRILYQHAMATVCPSVGEGFDFSGVESMASGGVVVASDIPVHREIYEDGSEYFDPYSTGSLVNAIKKVSYEDVAGLRANDLRNRGFAMVKRYSPDLILPKWRTFLSHVHSAHKQNRRFAKGQQPPSLIPEPELG